MEKRSEAELITAIQKNQESGFRLLLARYKEPVYWHIRRLVVAHADAQDVAQETFIRVFRSIGQLKKDASLAAWIYRIATNEALRFISSRKECRVNMDDAGDEFFDVMADEHVDYSDLESVWLQKAILALPPKQQVTFNLRYYDDLSYSEIAEIIGSTPDSAKANYHIAKEKIIDYLKNIG